MFQLLASSPANFSPELLSGKVRLRPPKLGDHKTWRALRFQSRSHLTRWEDDWPEDGLALHAFRRRLQHWERQRRARAILPLFVFECDGGALVGGVTLSNIRYGAAQSAILGYWIGSPFTRRGYGAAAVEIVLAHGFETIGLNRIEAACHPENIASQRLLERLGFVREGRARDYLKINGAWRDHDIYALTASMR